MLESILALHISLSEQKLYAVTDDGKIEEYIVSTGKPSTPTPEGEFTIGGQYEVVALTGDGYYIPGVRWVQCLTEKPEYCIHPNTTSTPLGAPASLGCVRMNEEDAESIFTRMEQGTHVHIQQNVSIGV